jgi:hypothetical protein
MEEPAVLETPKRKKKKLKLIDDAPPPKSPTPMKVEELTPDISSF